MNRKSNERFFKHHIGKTDVVDEEWRLRIATTYLWAVLVTGFEDGQLLEEDLEYNRISKIIARDLIGIKQGKLELNWVIDHREDVLQEARESVHDEKYKNALIFYAMYFEHEVNGLLNCLLRRRNTSEKTIRTILSRNLLDKLTWILELLEESPPNETFLRFLKPLSDDRNSFIHYKWIGFNPDQENPEMDFKAIEKNVTYLKHYASRLLYKGRKRIVYDKIQSIIEAVDQREED